MNPYWRLWYLYSTSHLASHLACVGMWEACVYHHISYFDRATSYHPYSYRDTYLLMNTRIGLYLRLVASTLVLLGRVSIICSLRKMFMGILWKKSTCHPFVVPGILNMAAGTCILIAVIWNYNSMMSEEGISFLPSSHLPFKPDMREVGNAMCVACLAAFMMMLSGLFHLSFKCEMLHVQPSAS